jgi:predicted PurR-regulated permease PerM
MSLVAILCTIGFTIIKSPYSVLYGITVGILDIFPLIGAGTFLVPVGIYYCIQGEYMNSIILFVLFVLCYLLREILEPKLMGTRIGMHPLVSLVSVFTGYKLFGVLGMLIGPFGYVFISEVLKVTSKKDSFTP